MLLLAGIANAQEKVHFKITDNKNSPVGFASIRIAPATDSTAVQETITDSLGMATAVLQLDQFYTVRVSSINFQSAEKNIVVKNAGQLFSIVLTPASGTLNQVIIRASKPLMRQEDDKTIVDPESLAAVSTNAFETIEKTPGLFIDPDGNIYISSTTPATVYINGREQRMSAADVASMLKSLPPNAIASIEILRTPSARYDASGGGGVVNVILKKGVRIGLTGSVNAGMQQGAYGNQYLGLNINNNNGRLTTYINLNVGSRNTLDRIRTDRIFAPDSLLSQDASTKYHSNNYYLGYGLNYELRKNWELSYDGRLSINHNDNNSRNLAFIQKISTSATSGFRQTDVVNDGNNVHINQGLNLKYKIDSAGSEWTTDASVTINSNRTDQHFTIGEGELENKPTFFSIQTNYVKKFPKQLTFESGLKTTQVRFRNSTDYYILSNGTKIRDNLRTGAYRYNESINAAYLQLSKTVSGIVVKAGTRMENTNMKGRQLQPKDTSFSIHRTDFFPYVYISRSLMKIAGYDLRAYLVYRRTISRPAYEYLNPSLRFIDPYLFETGNPSLRPQFTHNYEANISVDERPIMAIGFNDTKDIFTQVVYPTDTSSRVSFRTYDNLGSNKETYIRVLGAIPPGGKYFFVVGGQYNHNFYRGLYENKPFSFKRGSWTVFTYHTLRITPLMQFAMSGFARFNGQQQFYELGDFGEFRMSINQQFFKRKLVMTLSVNDLFRTNRNEFTINQGSINASGLREGDTRRFGLNLRYNFGIRKKEEQHMFNMEAPAQGS